MGSSFAKSFVIVAAVVAALLIDAPVAEAGCETSESYSSSTWQSCNSDTSYAGNFSSGCYGRCGPGCSWSFLGNVYTSACQTHDWCVRESLKTRSAFNAHANCVGSLGNAARSWWSNSWHTWKGKIRDKVTGFISNWL